MAASSAGGPVEIDSWISGATSASAAKVEVAEEARLLLGDRRDLRGGLAEAAEEAREVGALRREVLHHRLEVAQQAGQHAERLVDRLAAAGERGAELVEVLALRGARRLVERGEHLVDLDRLGGRPRGRDRRSGREAGAGVALRDLDVLQAERRARADDDRGVPRQRLDRRLELEAQLRVGGAVGPALREDLVDDADARAADPDLVAPHEVLRVGDVRAQVVGRDERQPVVRVVGEEHGDDDDERRRRADEHGVRRDRCRALPPHAPPPSR
jgi:hypothetical protein